MSKSKKDRAKKLFAKRGSDVTPIEAERRAIAEKTAKLRALRLARDEAEAKEKAEAKAAAGTRSRKS